MIRYDVVIAVLEAKIFALQPGWAAKYGWLPGTAPVEVMATSRKWSML